MSIKEIRIEDYLYDLPQERIALFPLEKRDQSSLLVFRNDCISQRKFSDLPDLLPSDSVLIWNNTKVIPARLLFKKNTGALIEIFLLEPVFPSGYSDMFLKTESCTWQAIIGNKKKWNGDPLALSINIASGKVDLYAEYSDSESNNTINLKWFPQHLTFAQIIELFGKTPIPPYLKRDSNARDKIDYQTVYANFDGSVAAPTAGLHFTQDLLEKLNANNVRINPITLHVGAGTFIPVKSKTIGDHQMHGETAIIGIPVIRDLLETPPGKLSVVGTTSVRSLESLYWLGLKIYKNPGLEPDHLWVDQWDAYETEPILEVGESMKEILKYLKIRNLEQIQFVTKMIIVPGYQFRLVSRLITNFHQPSSTLLLLVSALIGSKWRDVYEYALAHNFRFLSYGDSSLLETQLFKHA